MIYYPNKNYYVELIRGTVAFVKERRTGRTVGYWQDGKYTSYALNNDATIDVEGKVIETDETK